MQEAAGARDALLHTPRTALLGVRHVAKISPKGRNRLMVIKNTFINHKCPAVGCDERFRKRSELVRHIREDHDVTELNIGHRQ